MLPPLLPSSFNNIRSMPIPGSNLSLKNKKKELIHRDLQVKDKSHDKNSRLLDNITKVHNRISVENNHHRVLAYRKQVENSKEAHSLDMELVGLLAARVRSVRTEIS